MLAIAVALLLAVFAVAISLSATRTHLPSLQGRAAGSALVGILAVALTLPLVAFIGLVAARPSMRTAWRQAESPTRSTFLAYLVVEAVTALIAWTAFVLILVSGGH